MNVNTQGYYWCEASNRYGTAQSAKALLFVTGKLHFMYIQSIPSFKAIQSKF
jgi:glutathionylspermidine synthase